MKLWKLLIAFFIIMLLAFAAYFIDMAIVTIKYNKIYKSTIEIYEEGDWTPGYGYDPSEVLEWD